MFLHTLLSTVLPLLWGGQFRDRQGYNSTHKSMTQDAPALEIGDVVCVYLRDVWVGVGMVLITCTCINDQCAIFYLASFSL